MASVIQKHQIADFGGEEQSVDDGLNSRNMKRREKLATRIGAAP